jgi:hypothetical protein
MKTVFKVSILVLFFDFTTSIFAQKSAKVTSTIISTEKITSKTSPRLAIQAGYVNQIRYGSNVSSTYFNGARIGATYNYDLKNNFSLLTGVLYSVVYSDKKQGYPNSKFVNYITLGHFLDIPLQVMYNLPLSKTFKMFAFAGPNINIGLFQKQDITSTQTYLATDPLYVQPKTIDFYKESLLNRLNLQIGVGGGVQWKNYQLKSGYDFGINNLNKLNTGNQYQKGYYVTFSYEF